MIKPSSNEKEKTSSFDIQDKLLSKEIDIDSVINDLNLFLCLYQSMVNEVCLMDKTQNHDDQSRLIVNYQDSTKIITHREIAKNKFIRIIKKHSNRETNQVSYLLQNSNINYKVEKQLTEKSIVTEALNFTKQLEKNPSSEEATVNVVVEVYINGKYTRGFGDNLTMSNDKIRSLVSLFE